MEFTILWVNLLQIVALGIALIKLASCLPQNSEPFKSALSACLEAPGITKQSKPTLVTIPSGP